jgi:Sec-independent protein secretion pathway component TatC
VLQGRPGRRVPRLPFLLCQLWRFGAGSRRERRYAGPFVFFGWFFFVAGCLRPTVTFPFTVEFLIGMAKDFSQSCRDHFRLPLVVISASA